MTILSIKMSIKMLTICTHCSTIIIYGLAYFGWESKAIEDAFNLMNGVRTGAFKPVESKNWGPGISEMSSEEDENSAQDPTDQ